LVNAAVLAALLLLVPVIAVQFLQDQVIIQPFPVPQAMAEQGLTPDVAANRLWDGLNEEIALAATSKQAIAALPANQRVDFAVPDSGISIDALVYYVRHFFHAYPTRISGEFRCADAACASEGVSLRIRVMRDTLQVIQLPPMGSDPEEAYFRKAALRVLDVLDPFTAAAARADTDPTTALASAERLVRTGHPDAVWAANLIGNIQLQQGDPAASIAAYRQALALNPDFSIAAANLGGALVQAQDLDAAEKVFDTLEAKGKDKHLALGRAKLALARNDLIMAKDYLMQAEALDPGTPIYHFLAGEAAYQAGNFAMAAESAAKALAVAPGDYGAVMLLSAIRAMEGSFDQAEAVLAKGAQAAPDVADFHGQRAMFLHILKRTPEALFAVDRALALEPDNRPWQLSRADILLTLNRAPEALMQLAPVLAAAPEDAGAWLLQGRALVAQGDADAARAALEAAIRYDTGGNAASAEGYLAILDQTAAKD
jgi:predicted Zn-dependent protease